MNNDHLPRTRHKRPLQYQDDPPVELFTRDGTAVQGYRVDERHDDRYKRVRHGSDPRPDQRTRSGTSPCNEQRTRDRGDSSDLNGSGSGVDTGVGGSSTTGKTMSLTGIWTSRPLSESSRQLLENALPDASIRIISPIGQLDLPIPERFKPPAAHSNHTRPLLQIRNDTPIPPRHHRSDGQHTSNRSRSPSNDDDIELPRTGVQSRSSRPSPFLQLDTGDDSDRMFTRRPEPSNKTDTPASRLRSLPPDTPGLSDLALPDPNEFEPGNRDDGGTGDTDQLSRSKGGTRTKKQIADAIRANPNSIILSGDARCPNCRDKTARSVKICCVIPDVKGKCAPCAQNGLKCKFTNTIPGEAEDGTEDSNDEGDLWELIGAIGNASSSIAALNEALPQSATHLQPAYMAIATKLKDDTQALKRYLKGRA